MKSRKNREKESLKRKIPAVILLTVVLLMQIFPAPVLAAESETYVQCSISPASWEILTAVIQNEVGITEVPLETRRMDQDLLKKLTRSSDSLAPSIEALKALKGHVAAQDGKVSGLLSAGSDKDQYRVLSFPGYQVASSPKDYEQALLVNQSLIFDFNEAFRIYVKEQNRKKSADAEDFLDAVIGFLTYTQKHADGKVDGEGKSYLSMKSDGVTYRFCWRTEKGYVQKKTGLIRAENGKDAAYVNWGMLCLEAFQNYSLEGEEAVLSENVYNGEPNQLERVFTGLLSGLLQGIRSFFGLWSTDELLFNQGFRKSGYVGGIFPKNWEPSVWALFFLFEVASAMVIFFSVVQNILKKAASTMNFSMRMEWMEEIRDLIVTAVLLALLPFFLRLFVSMSGALTEAAADLIPMDANGDVMKIRDLVSGLAAGGKTLSGVLIQFLWFGIEVYFNFFYAVRALSVAILITVSPVMVAFFSMGSAKKQTALLWSKELLANVFIQPVQAFLMVLILLLPHSPHGFDNFIALYAMIPLTAVLRGLFFGPAGSWADQTVGKARSRFTGALAGGAAAAGTAVAAGRFQGGFRPSGGTYDARMAGKLSEEKETAGNAGFFSKVPMGDVEEDETAGVPTFKGALKHAAGMAGGVGLSAAGGAIGGAGLNHAAAIALTGAGTRLVSGAKGGAYGRNSFDFERGDHVATKAGERGDMSGDAAPFQGMESAFYEETGKNGDGFREANLYDLGYASYEEPSGTYEMLEMDLNHFGIFAEDAGGGRVAISYTDPALLSAEDRYRLDGWRKAEESGNPQRNEQLAESGILKIDPIGDEGGMRMLVDSEKFVKNYGMQFDPHVRTEEGEKSVAHLKEPYAVPDLNGNESR